MTITTQHPASSYGMPIILDNAGAPMDYADGIRALRKRHGWNCAALGEICGVSARTVEGWEQGRRQPDAAALNAIRDAIKK